MFRPTWPSSRNAHYLQNTWEETNNAENYKKKWDLIVTKGTDINVLNKKLSRYRPEQAHGDPVG
jgi:hypothetical protein